MSSPSPGHSFPTPITMPTGEGTRLGIGCIGTGFIMADCQLVAYEQAGLNVVAIAGRNFDRAQRVAAERGVKQAQRTVEELLANPEVEVLDIAVPPDIQMDVIRKVVEVHSGSSAPRFRGILAQKPLGVDLAQAQEIVRLCDDVQLPLAVNQNMRFDPSVRTCRQLLESDQLGEPILATIDMRAIPHWMPWQARLGWVTLRIMSIHHFDTMRYWFGNPERIFCSTRPDPRTSFPHSDGICLSILEYATGLRVMICDDVWTGPAREGAASDIGIEWRVEGTQGLAKGTIGWPDYPQRRPSTIDFTLAHGPSAGEWQRPRWEDVWFPDAFIGPMADLLCAIESGTTSSLNGSDNLYTMAVVEAAYQSAREHRAIELESLLCGTDIG